MSNLDWADDEADLIAAVIHGHRHVDAVKLVADRLRDLRRRALMDGADRTLALVEAACRADAGAVQ